MTNQGFLALILMLFTLVSTGTGTTQDSRGKVIVYRVAGEGWPKGTLTVGVKGVAMAKVREKRVAELSLPVGSHLLQILGMNKAILGVSINEQDTVYVRMQQNRHNLYFEQVPESRAAVEIASFTPRKTK
jgi:hypothetical protein